MDSLPLDTLMTLLMPLKVSLDSLLFMCDNNYYCM